ncbi:hypothetical protein [Streptomyces sp. NPDC048659]|uniref:hypothetical protein n=1 Tax=Streptomyces sp. NPDC048659 TaxID=3155489 RepID=UPI0034381100
MPPTRPTRPVRAPVRAAGIPAPAQPAPAPAQPAPALLRPAPARPAPAPVPVTVVRAEDAPGPTLVVRLDQLPPGALGLGRELAALRRALAPTPYAALNKIALYGPSGRPGDADLDYRFVQALPDGRFDFRTGCGHSLLACVVAEGRPGPVTVRALTTGDTVRVTEEPGGDGAHTLHFLRAPDAPGTLPTGRPAELLLGVPVSLVSYGNPYVFVDASHLDPDRPKERLLELRAAAARLLGYAPHSPLPKIAAFRRAPGGGLSVRALTVGGWHPRLALTGAAALAAAAALDGTVVPGDAGGTVSTPGGTVTVSTGPDRVGVHHKRARVLDRIELPWRIHATA